MAAQELAARENCNPKHIGIIDCNTGLYNEAVTKHLNAATRMIDWGRKNEIDFIVYVALSRKFKDILKVAFTPENAIFYLNQLDNGTRNLALEHIASIPNQIDTNFRKLFRQVYK